MEPRCTRSIPLEWARSVALYLAIAFAVSVTTRLKLPIGEMTWLVEKNIATDNLHQRRSLYEQSAENMGTMMPTAAEEPSPGSDSQMQPPLLQFAFLFPLLSVSAIMWVVHRNKLLCCAGDIAFEEQIPSEIFFRNKSDEREENRQDIELQSISTYRTASLSEIDPVVHLSMLNQSDCSSDLDDSSVPS